MTFNINFGGESRNSHFSITNDIYSLRSNAQIHLPH